MEKQSPFTTKELFSVDPDSDLKRLTEHFENREIEKLVHPFWEQALEYFVVNRFG